MNAYVAIDTLGTERLEIVRSSERLAEIGPAWTALWRRVNGLIFQSHAWVSGWWNTIADQDKRGLRIGLIWSGDLLTAVIPLATAKRKGVRFLEWAASSHTDYGDLLTAPECSAVALQRLWQQLSASGGFDLAFLNRLLPEASARRLITAGLSGGTRMRQNYRQEISYRVAGEWENGAAWLQAQPKKTRKEYRRCQNVMGEFGKITFRLLPADAPLAPVLERLAALKCRWLAEHERQSTLFDAGAATLAALVQALADARILRIFVLECDGRIIAVSVNFVQRNTMMAFVTTYDPDFARGSPGVVLMMDYIQWSLNQGHHTVDFLCGAERFKHKFATQSVTLESMLGARTLRGALVSIADGAREKIRSARRGQDAAASPSAQAASAEV